MCARRFLLVVFVLILLGVAGAFAIFQWGSQALVRQAMPKGHFEAPAPNSGFDYAEADGWLSRAGEPRDASEWRPDGWPPPTLEPRPAAVFYIHPTTYLDRDRWNAPLDAGSTVESRTRLFVQSQASAFNEVANAWAPRYRQAAYGAFLLDNGDAQKALDLAYSDLARAFAQFLREVPAGTPIILAGHSQGALHLTRLLREQVAGEPLADRIVAAYVVGWPVSRTADLPSLGLPICRRPDQARCILTWMSVGEPANPDFILGPWEDSLGPKGGKRRRQDMLCVNPISGELDGAAPAAANRGTLLPSADLSSAELVVGQVGARCKNGLLVIDGAGLQLGPYVLPGNNYHAYDYALFWGSIREDAGRRLEAWRRR